MLGPWMMLSNQQIWKILVGQEHKAKANPGWLTMASSCLLHGPWDPYMGPSPKGNLCSEMPVQLICCWSLLLKKYKNQGMKNFFCCSGLLRCCKSPCVKDGKTTCSLIYWLRHLLMNHHVSQGCAGQQESWLKYVYVCVCVCVCVCVYIQSNLEKEQLMVSWSLSSDYTSNLQ